MATAFAPKFADLVRNYTSTTGTADFQLGDPVSGYTGFASAVQTGDRFYYSAIGVTNPSEHEVGRGTLLANGLIAREPVAGPKTDFSAGAKTIALVVAAEWYGSARGVDSRAALASQPAGGTAMLLERGCEGPFAWDGDDLSDQVAGDPAGGLYIPPSGEDGSGGAWVRTGGAPLRPEWFGAKGDGATNDTAAFQALAAIVNSNDGGTIELSANATYIVGMNVPQTAEQTEANYYTFLYSNVLQIDGCSQPVVINGNGATLKAPDGFKYGTFTAAGAPITYPAPYYGPGIAAAWLAMIEVRNCTGPVTVRDLDLDGNIANAALGGPWGDSGWQLPGSGFSFTDNSGMWRLINCRAFHQPQDGISVNDPGTAATAPSLSGTEGCSFVENGRNNLSLVGGVGHVFRTTKFNRARRNLGSFAGSAPGAGIDFEAEGGKLVRGTIFRDCETTDNYGAGHLHPGSMNVSDISWHGGKLIGTTSFSYYGGGNLGIRYYGTLILGTLNNLASEWFVDCVFDNDPARSPTGTVFNYATGQLAYLSRDNRMIRCEVINSVGGQISGNGVTHQLCEDCTLRNKSATGRLDFYGRFRGSRTTFIAEPGSQETMCLPGTQGPYAGLDAGPAEDEFTYVATNGSVSLFKSTYAMIPDKGVTFGKIQDLSGTDKLLGRSSAGAGPLQEIACTAAGRALIDDADAAAQRTTLGLAAVAASGSGADLAASSVTYNRMQAVGAAKLLGNAGGTAGPLAEVGLSGGMTFAGGNLGLGSISPSSLATAGPVTSSGGGIGYATGAGGAVTQATSKSTGVTLNKLCGQITTSAVALAAGGTASFQVTNSQVASTDVVHLALASGNAAAGTYNYQVDKVAAGSFSIWVKNISAASLSEALIFNFTVNKAVSA